MSSKAISVAFPAFKILAFYNISYISLKYKVSSFLPFKIFPFLEEKYLKT
jgi:hypothetical protein